MLDSLLHLNQFFNNLLKLCMLCNQQEMKKTSEVQGIKLHSSDELVDQDLQTTVVKQARKILELQGRIVTLETQMQSMQSFISQRAMMQGGNAPAPLLLSQATDRALGLGMSPVGSNANVSNQGEPKPLLGAHKAMGPTN